MLVIQAPLVQDWESRGKPADTRPVASAIIAQLQFLFIRHSRARQLFTQSVLPTALPGRWLCGHQGSEESQGCVTAGRQSHRAALGAHLKSL